MRRRIWLVFLFLLLLAGIATAAVGASSAIALLLDKARSLEGRGRMDLATQTWQQVLLADPNQPEALAGLSRAAKEGGRAEEAKSYLERLKRVNPKDPAIARIEEMRALTSQQRTRLAEASRLARTGHADDAVRIYREVFGNDPPPGDWAITYFETMAATTTGREPAIENLRHLTQRYPENQQYRLSLARLLTYDAKTRQEGVHMLSTLGGSRDIKEQARQAWRQALLWEESNPAYKSLLGTYLERYSDSVLAKIAERFKQQQVEAAAKATITAPATGADEGKGYEALKAGNLAAAENYFSKVLHTQPKSSGALAGLGYVRMKQENFDEAAKNFEAAKAISPQSKNIIDGFNTAKFWALVKQGSVALDHDRSEEAARSFQAALELRPNYPEGLRGLAGVRMKQSQFKVAADNYRQLTTLDPQNAKTWTGLILAEYKSGDMRAAADTVRQIPPAVRLLLGKDADYQALMAAVYEANGQSLEAEKYLRQAMLLASASPGGKSASELQVEFASTLMEGGQAARAADYFKRVTEVHPENLKAWQGLLGCYVQIREYARAVATLRRIPQSAYDEVIRNVDFLNVIAAIHMEQGQLDTAEAFLQRASQLDVAPDSKSRLTTQMEFAGLFLKQGKKENANELYQSLVDQNENRPDVWQAYVSALHEQHEDERALAQALQAPEHVRQILNRDTGFVSVMAAIYVSVGQADEGIRLLKQARGPYEVQRRLAPADIDIQLAWALLAKEDREEELYSLLAQTAARNDLTPHQQEDLRAIWGNWSLTRAQQALDAGDLNRCISILSAAVRAIPGDPKLKSMLAGTFMKTGDKVRALRVYERWGLGGGNSDDYRGAIGSAMALQNPQLADFWLRQGLHKWPQDATLLDMAGRIAATRGDYAKAQLYWKQAIAALPAHDRAAPVLGGQNAKGLNSLLGDAAENLSRLLVPTGGARNDSSSLLPVVSQYPNRKAASDEFLREPASTLSPAMPIIPALRPRRTESAVLVKGRDGFNITPDGKTPSSSQSQSKSADDSGRLSVSRLQQDALTDIQDRDYTPAISKEQRATTSKDMDAAVESVAPPSARDARWDSTFVSTATLSRKEGIEGEIAAIQLRNVPFVSAGTDVLSRSGTPGFDRTITESAHLVVSAPIGDQNRVSLRVEPVFIYAGNSSTTSDLQLGTLPLGASFPTQAATGVAAQGEFSRSDFGLMVGTTPQGFLVTNLTAGVRYRPMDGPFTFTFSREPVKDTVLSYSGVRDPNSGLTFGGVMATGGSVKGNWGSGTSGIYVSGGYQNIQGQQVADNSRIDGNVGTYWRVLERPTGSLSVGMNLTGMHYDKNLRFFTLGQGGYFSPQSYFLFNAPIRWVGKWQRIEYLVAGSLGSQYFEEDSTPYFPLASPGQANPYYVGQAKTGANYSLDLRVGYRLAPNWYLGGFVTANNTQNYTSQAVGFNVRYLIMQAPSVSSDFQMTPVPDWRGVSPSGVQ
ncbi:MAG: cellulose synthase subunit BcsC-related outer membrane protein [Candidatus Korobacteraceae bacterium]